VNLISGQCAIANCSGSPALVPGLAWRFHRVGGLATPNPDGRPHRKPRIASIIVIALAPQEFQAAHERIFKAMDANKDGRLTLDEIQAFMQGTRRSAPQQ
jgi:hypothetical protein